ncbi:hypothetical protein [Polycladidibacter stylochi]|uniref:hypothetical protein n=1 Tax=Polycladidibacter stylochi TaxID=1807766 RepID=UPI00082D517F|nr:hypothetical protein [Pseudovibrio stylochi]
MKNKFPHHFKGKFMAIGMMTIMLLGMPAISTYQKLPADADFLSAWLTLLKIMLPVTLPTVLVVATCVNFIITKFLVRTFEEEVEFTKAQ